MSGNRPATVHSARVVHPIQHVAPTGQVTKIPVGPCLVEELGAGLVDLVWGAKGQNSTVLQAEQAERAEQQGVLLLLD